MPDVPLYRPDQSSPAIGKGTKRGGSELPGKGKRPRWERRSRGGTGSLETLALSSGSEASSDHSIAGISLAVASSRIIEAEYNVDFV